MVDFIIVGAGSAGCVLAARLSESGRHTVLLLEAGGEDRNWWIHVPLGVGKLLADARYVWKFETEPQETMRGQRIYWPRGKVLGGSSALNGMAYVWGDPGEYDRWGLPGWRFRDLHPYFRRMEDCADPELPGRGHGGPVRITDRKRRDPDPLSDAFLRACVQAGIPETPDYNAGSYEGARYLEQTAHKGRRVSTAVAYLRAARRRPNLEVRTGALVTRVLFEGVRAVGVEYRRAGELRAARAAREVLLSAGAVQSPQVLELSGVGNADVLQRLGIPVAAHRPAVGENMIDHLQVRNTYETTLPITINDVMRSLPRRLLVGLQYLLTRKGLMAGTSSTAHAITGGAMVRIYHISGKDRYSRSEAGGIDRYSGFSIGGFKLHPRSRGSIHVRSREALEPPAIQPNYLAHPADQEGAVSLLRLARRIASQAAMKPFIVAEHRPGAHVSQDAELLEYARETGQTAWHAVGTCRMGGAADSVVDARLRVHGLQGLRVIDASVMPTIASSNTNAPAMMIGERGADLVLQDAREHDHGHA